MQNTLGLVQKTLTRTSIPKAIREQTWIRYNGPKFESKCNVTWCQNIITPFTFEVGHNIPASRGGDTNIDNLRPICTGCNRSMGNRYTIDEFSQLSNGENEVNKAKGKSKHVRVTGGARYRKYLLCWHDE